MKVIAWEHTSSRAGGTKHHF
ncbi:hypothetical protein SBA5_50016 [Candidatus Sulfotelmatomonas gaucii]|uniref:Uncharacterized protein n=1 Tax=Candidatus Sulfuritelmatomonas gaucii TaxID=2043161 RepID=A0A2N9LQC5_9BACT|nr:hypothetical protein SBA5_50016 [Candidatus Sulfotelmatomonas gaucii]